MTDAASRLNHAARGRRRVRRKHEIQYVRLVPVLAEVVDGECKFDHRRTLLPVRGEMTAGWTWTSRGTTCRSGPRGRHAPTPAARQLRARAAAPQLVVEAGAAGPGHSRRRTRRRAIPSTVRWRRARRTRRSRRDSMEPFRTSRRRRAGTTAMRGPPYFLSGIQSGDEVSVAARLVRRSTNTRPRVETRSFFMPACTPRASTVKSAPSALIAPATALRVGVAFEEDAAVALAQRGARAALPTGSGRCAARHAVISA